MEENVGVGNVIVGNAPALRAALSRAQRAANTLMPILVTGESGTGKELLARFVHDNSPRRHGPYVVVNCAGFPRELFDSALFGHERGAFTGARESQPGCFEKANGGTLVLDEVGELPLDLQPKLLRIVEEGCVTPLGSRRTVRVDVRLLAVTNRDLYSEAGSGAFRLDLYHRLCGIKVALPPLRERPTDLRVLVEHFCSAFSSTFDPVPSVQLSPLAMHALERHTWPGNVRELRHLIWRSLALGGAPIDEAQLLDEMAFVQTPAAHDTLVSTRAAEDRHPYQPQTDVQAYAGTQSAAQQYPDDPAWLCLQGKSWAEVEAAVIRHHLRAAGGNRKRAAATLGISRTTLYERLRRLPA